ncbi:MAG: AAA family ATPase [Clostridia bacterium]|jgi:hypothetical protein
MERKMLKTLSEWKQTKDRMPLVLHGARQVGKTYIVLNFGKQNYKNSVYFNFEGNKELSKIFDRDLDPVRIIRELSVKSGQSILKEETLIFFDEIQACEKALTSLKYFYENTPEYHVIAAGSLLGVAINRQSYSFPVGKVEIKTLYPLDFEEFLWAVSGKEIAELIRMSFEKSSEFSLHQKALDLYRTYLVTGGMPAAVQEYIDNKDFDYVSAKKKNIIDAYVADMAKYATVSETTKLMAAFESIPAQLAKQNRKFQYKVIKSGARAYQYETTLDWLKASGIIIKTIKTKEGKIPLNVFADNSNFKVYMTDVGLLCEQFGVPAIMILSESEGYQNFKGALAENYVAGALTIAGNHPYYWESNGKSEVDFVIQNKSGEIIPIEVKASDNVRSKSLNEFVKKYNPPYSVRISSKNFGFENNIKSVPLYAVFCLDE